MRQRLTQISKACTSFLGMLFALLLPVECLGCGQENIIWCEACQRKLAAELKLRRVYLDVGDNLDAVYTLAGFNNRQLQSLIKTFKYKFITDLGPILSNYLVKEAGEVVVFQRGDLVVSVPLHPRRLRWRGFNQSEVLASGFADYFRLKYSPVLRRVHYRGPQAKLAQKQRLSNVSGSFAVQGEVTGQIVWLVDDVATTGATLDECARVLKAAGARKVLGLCLAHG